MFGDDRRREAAATMGNLGGGGRAGSTEILTATMIGLPWRRRTMVTLVASDGKEQRSRRGR